MPPANRIPVKTKGEKVRSAMVCPQYTTTRAQRQLLSFPLSDPFRGESTTGETNRGITSSHLP
jgi:hypothetical protein